MRAPLDDSLSDRELDSAPKDGGHPGTDGAVRLWLVSGVHSPSVDPRRRAGAHGTVRRLLVADVSTTGRKGGLQSVVSALQRQVLHNSLAKLEALERQIVTLAYLEGRTNRQIAEHLGVSITTVKRRLWTALALLEQYLAASGAWLASILLIGLALVTRWARPSRMADWVQPVAATVATGVVAATVVGLTVASPGRPGDEPSTAPSTTAAGAAEVAISGVSPAALGIVIPSSQITSSAVATSPTDDPDSTGRKAGLHRHVGRPDFVPPREVGRR